MKLCRAKDIFTKFQEVARKYIQLGPSLTSWSIGNKNGIYIDQNKKGVYIFQDIIDGLHCTTNLPLDVTLQGFQRLVLATVINGDTGSFSLKTKRNLLFFVIIKYISNKQMRVQIRSVDDEVSWDITSGFVISVKIVPNFFYYNFNEYDIFFQILRNFQKTFTTNFQNR